MAMIRARGDVRGRQPFRLIYSVRTPEDACYADELARRVRDDPGLDVRFVYTRKTPGRLARAAGADRRGDAQHVRLAARLRSRTASSAARPSFVESAADILVALGHDPKRIRTERFGGTSMTRLVSWTATRWPGTCGRSSRST